TITTSVAHGTSTAAVSSTQATITDAALSVNAVPITINEGSTFSGTVAILNDANSFAPINDFTARITWGDGTTSAGSLLADPTVAGQFRVIGSHFFANGPAVLFDRVDVTDKDAPTAPIGGTSTIT